MFVKSSASGLSLAFAYFFYFFFFCCCQFQPGVDYKSVAYIKKHQFFKNSDLQSLSGHISKIFG